MMTNTDASEPTLQSAPRVSLRPALIVILIVAVITIGGGLLTIFSSKSAKTPYGSANVANLPARLVVEGVHFDPARPLLEKTELIALVPHDIISSLYLPVDVHFKMVVNLDNGNGPFDRQLNLTSGVSQVRLTTAYMTLLNQYGWKQSGTQPVAVPSGSTGTELLSQRASRDGYNWEVGITITTDTQVVHPNQPSGTNVQPTRLTMRLLQVPEGN